MQGETTGILFTNLIKAVSIFPICGKTLPILNKMTGHLQTENIYADMLAFPVNFNTFATDLFVQIIVLLRRPRMKKFPAYKRMGSGLNC